MKTDRLFYMALVVMTLTACSNDPDEPVQPGNSPVQATVNKVFEYTPAPGQFINDPATMGTAFKSAAEAAQWAHGRLADGLYVSLGGFGGYIVAGFDHNVVAGKGEYDFAIAGNAYVNMATGGGGSNEPGVVWVMQDTNGNGLPDDQWYQLKGSAYSDPETIFDYQVTYYRPSEPGQDIRWTDNRGGMGVIAHVPKYHKQDYYYPMWIAGETLTLSGTCLPSQTSLNTSTGNWESAPFGWGYADNMGSDNVALDGFGQCNRFRIFDAVTASGEPANLKYINFVKVQTGVNTDQGWLGEVSTEICSIFDLHP